MVWESFDVVRFDRGPLLQSQVRKAYITLIITARGVECDTS